MEPSTTEAVVEKTITDVWEIPFLKLYQQFCYVLKTTKKLWNHFLIATIKNKWFCKVAKKSKKESEIGTYDYIIKYMPPKLTK